MRRIAHRVPDDSGLLGSRNQGDHYADRAEIEHTHDVGGIVARHPHQRVGAADLERLHQRHEIAPMDEAMLEIEDHPVEPGRAELLGSERALQVEPGADRRRAVLELLAYRVHAEPSFSKVDRMTAVGGASQYDPTGEA